MRIFFSVGEPSGDLHGANLVRALRQHAPNVECFGFGGPRMAEAGCDVRVDLTLLAVMWISRVLTHLRTFLRLLRQADQMFHEERPDVVVLIDYPGFNWWIARRAKRHGIPVVYYSPPQLWAWGSWRVAKLRRLVDHLLCALPFEIEWYRRRGCQATFVGHPYFDELRGRVLDQAWIDSRRSRSGRQLTFLPGSRQQEVIANLPVMLAVAQHIHAAAPDVRFAFAAFRPEQAVYISERCQGLGLPLEVFAGRTPELIESADCCLAVSGSVSLELLGHAKPTVILYQCSRFGLWVQSWLRRSKFITLVNLLAEPEPWVPRATAAVTAAARDASVLFPEYLGYDDRSADIARQLLVWLTDEAERQGRIARLIALRQRVAHGGASQAAARYLLDVVQGPRSAVPPPHLDRDARTEQAPIRDAGQGKALRGG